DAPHNVSPPPSHPPPPSPPPTACHRAPPIVTATHPLSPHASHRHRTPPTGTAPVFRHRARISAPRPTGSSFHPIPAARGSGENVLMDRLLHLWRRYTGGTPRRRALTDALVVAGLGVLIFALQPGPFFSDAPWRHFPDWWHLLLLAAGCAVMLAKFSAPALTLAGGTAI